MATNADVRITVLKRTFNPDAVARYGEGTWAPCERLSEGQVFISTGANMPDGFCPWAWADIHKYVLVVARGGNHDGRRPGTNVACCSDGYRPVIFAIERIAPA
jgi:uncharacterized repeat protein (TIGR04076 family)